MEAAFSDSLFRFSLKNPNHKEHQDTQRKHKENKIKLCSLMVKTPDLVFNHVILNVLCALVVKVLDLWF
jgi:hypothetical protein